MQFICVPERVCSTAIGSENRKIVFSTMLLLLLFVCFQLTPEILSNLYILSQPGYRYCTLVIVTSAVGRPLIVVVVNKLQAFGNGALNALGGSREPSLDGWCPIDRLNYWFHLSLPRLQ